MKQGDKRSWRLRGDDHSRSPVQLDGDAVAPRLGDLAAGMEVLLGRIG